MAEYDHLLDGTPYLFTDGCDPESEISRIFAAQRDISRRLTVVYGKLRHRGLLRDVRTTTQTYEIFESNAIEGAGLSLRGTSDVLGSKLADQAVDLVRKGMLLNSIKAERKILDVLGMRAAKDLASTLAEDRSGKGLTQSEIRSIHSLVATHERFAGSYRDEIVQIYKAEHEPPHPIEVPRMMGDLVDWANNERNELPTILRAAVIHGWLTHVHPFDDGNGRVARMLVNMLMAQAGLPPVIIRHRADRARYIDALAHSDKAGDILPFAGVFLSSLNRHMSQVEKPRFIKQVFAEEIRSRGTSLYDHWLTSVQNFVEKLSTNLSMYRLKLTQVGEIDRTSFALLRDGDSSGNVWFLKVTDYQNRELLIWYGYSSWKTARVTLGQKKLPSMFFSVRNYDIRLEPYRRTYRDELEGLHEIVVVPDVPVRVYMAIYDDLVKSRIDKAAEEVAGTIARAFSRSDIPVGN